MKRAELPPFDARCPPRHTSRDRARPSAPLQSRSGPRGIRPPETGLAGALFGHTLLYSVNSVICANPHLYSKMPFDSLKAFVPISLVVNLGYVLVARDRYEDAYPFDNIGCS